jgi:hypothetical protein
MANYEAVERFWNGACYEACDRHDLSAETLAAAVAEVRATKWGSSREDYDIEVEIEDEEGEVVATEYFENSAAENQQENMDQKWSDEGEFSTDYLGVKDGEWYQWSSNGGSRGAYDRMDGSGRWIETYEEPKAFTAREAHQWLMSAECLDAREAFDAMRAYASDECDQIREIADLVVRIDSHVQVYFLGDSFITVGPCEIAFVDRDEAEEFAGEWGDDDDAEKVCDFIAD